MRYKSFYPTIPQLMQMLRESKDWIPDLPSHVNTPYGLAEYVDAVIEQKDDYGIFRATYRIFLNEMMDEVVFHILWDFHGTVLLKVIWWTIGRDEESNDWMIVAKSAAYTLETLPDEYYMNGLTVEDSVTLEL